MYISSSTITLSPTMAMRTGLILLVVFSSLTYADELSRVRVSDSVCPTKSIGYLIFGIDDSICRLSGIDYYLGVIEGDETSLQKALSIVDTNTHDYVAVLFYASWCPFSTVFKPSLSTMSSLYPSIPHFAIKESVVKPSTLSKYGVNGFPTLFVLNSTMRARYHGSRTLSSLVSFYTDVTGLNAEQDKTFLNKVDVLVHDKGDNNNIDPEICPFSWAKSPENLLKQETYLALATLFVVFRTVYLIYPFIVTSVQYARRTWLLWDHPYAYLNRAIQLFSSLIGCMGIGFYNERKH
ncbi:putative Thioredoxin domain, 5'-adenylylsulfate reductase-like protein [Helianthus annuus]|uniref:5'-adenylylsulfate reductase-like 4 n=1 Tax=Helianthus annuus TaxID=4232 RepID=UPI001652C574|nr:5'-adenylylsulfate reductase-like 4 [Helianthus annuus]KAJ0512324.1 putative Thioredoxin domain, 5'-adenylylsulfate reductase-like protein [Helianthus annuus]KAJ0528419.1 putative Thioredoxin domain, 5'-adenylylsulfate reductase-like protein [Helianthus annuus]